LVFVAAVVVTVAGVVAPAAAAADGPMLTVRLTADQPVVTVDRDDPRDVVMAYEIVVTNVGGAIAPGVVVEAALPGGVARRDVGDVAPAGEWREVVQTTIPAATVRGGPVDAVAVARSADGVEVRSAPSRVDVQVISSAVYERDDEVTAPATAVTEPPTEVLGAVHERPLPTTLARTGVAAGALATLGVALVLFGGLLVRRTSVDG
jgi:hypothetical protein